MSAADRLLGSARWHAQRMPERLVERGVPPARLGWRWVATEAPAAYAARSGGTVETIHPAAEIPAPPPLNVPADALETDPGWWGFSLHDVPHRRARATEIVTVPDCRIVAFHDERGEFHPAVLTPDGRALDVPQSRYRPGHAAVMREPPARTAWATWVVERVYDNHSHWLTSHLPKIGLLAGLGRIEGMLLPERRTATIDDSLGLLGLDPSAFPAFDPSRPLDVGTLTIVVADRFRPELLRPLRDALAAGGVPRRRIFISRAEARGRKLLGEEEMWPELARRGFERVVMERLSFAEQVRLMAETAVLLAPHGAGLTNMIACPDGATVIEIADPLYPNPNFYALASAMGHRYALIHADAVGEGHRLHRDLRIEPGALLAAVDALLGEGGG